MNDSGLGLEFFDTIRQEKVAPESAGWTCFINAYFNLLLSLSRDSRVTAVNNIFCHDLHRLAGLPLRRSTFYRCLSVTLMLPTGEILLLDASRHMLPRTRSFHSSSRMRRSCLGGSSWQKHLDCGHSPATALCKLNTSRIMVSHPFPMAAEVYRTNGPARVAETSSTAFVR